MDKQLDAENFPAKLDLGKFEPKLIEELERLSVLQLEASGTFSKSVNRD